MVLVIGSFRDSIMPVIGLYFMGRLAQNLISGLRLNYY